MDRSWFSGAKVTPPALPGSPSVGYPTDGDPLANEAPTIPGAWWFHMITEELRAVLVGASVTPVAGTVNQLLGALQTLFGISLATTAVRLPGGKILQWGNYASDITGPTSTILFPVTFPSACDGVFAMPLNPTPDGSADAWLTRRSMSTTGFVIGSDWAGSGGSDVVHGADWFAIGR